MDPQSLRRNMRLSIIEGALATSMASLLTGVVITSFALALGANRWQIGVLAALPTLANFAQLAGSYLLERRVERKTLCLSSLWLGRAIWIPLGIGALWYSTGNRQWLLYGLLLTASVAHALWAVGGVAWLSWIRDLVPLRQRVSFLALRNQFDTFLSLVIGIIASVFIDWMQDQDEPSLGGYAWVLLLAVACGLISMVILRRIPDPGMVRVAPPTLSKMFREPLENRNFRQLIGFYATWNLANNLATPFFAVFLLQKLHLSLWHASTLMALGSVAALAANRFWSRWSSRFGTKPVLYFATLGDALFPLACLFLEPQWTSVLPLVYLLGVFGSPVAVGPNNLVLAVAPDRNTSSYIAVFHSIVGPTTAVAAVLGGLISHWLMDWNLSLGAFSFGGLKTVFLLSAVGRVGSLVLLRGVREPESVSVRHMFKILARARRIARVAHGGQVVPQPQMEPATWRTLHRQLPARLRLAQLARKTPTKVGAVGVRAASRM